jgi:hypothetical protein
MFDWIGSAHKRGDRWLKHYVPKQSVSARKFHHEFLCRNFEESIAPDPLKMSTVSVQISSSKSPQCRSTMKSDAMSVTVKVFFINFALR